MNKKQISNEELTLVEIIENTPGGKTYIFYDEEHDRKLPRCNRKIVNEDRTCVKIAGWQTDHVGYGACIRHGGNAGRISNTADRRFAFMARSRLKQKMDLLLGDMDALLDLSKELAAAKAIADEIIENFPETDDDNFSIMLARFTNVLKALATVTDKISLIKSRNALTTAQVMYVRAAIVDVFVKHIQDPKVREQAVNDLVFRLGGGVENFQTGQKMYKEMKDSGVQINLLQ